MQPQRKPFVVEVKKKRQLRPKRSAAKMDTEVKGSANLVVQREVRA